MSGGLDSQRVARKLRTPAVAAVGVSGAAVAATAIAGADTSSALALVPLALASLLPAAAVALLLTRATDTRMLTAVATGGFLVLAAYGLSLAATSHSGGFSTLSGTQVATAAAIEEAVKLGAVAAFVYAAGLDTTRKAAAVGASVGLGFAGAENLVHMTSSSEPVLGALTRSAIAPVHVLTTAVAAALLVSLTTRLRTSSYTPVASNSNPASRHACTGVCVAASVGVAGLLHALYNLGVLGFLHPYFVDGVGYVAFATSFYVVAFTATVAVSRDTEPGSFDPEDERLHGDVPTTVVAEESGSLRRQSEP